MSAAIDCYNDLKYLSYQFKDDSLTHCQRLDLLCRALGFNNRHHFEQKITELPDVQIGKYSTKLMRQACARVLPKPNVPYYEFIAQSERRMRFYSLWAGWDKCGREVRIPRDLDGAFAVPRLRVQMDAPVYVIETDRQLVAWRNTWFGMAYVPEALAREHMKEAFARIEAVIKGPRNKAYGLEEDFNDNYATWYPLGK